jgi:tetratricopeptide (TPR) repeat protein
MPLGLCARRPQEWYNGSTAFGVGVVMNRLPVVLALSCLGLLAFPSISRGQIGGDSTLRRSVGGHVYYADTGDPAENVLVELRSGQGLREQQKITTTTGEFMFIELQPTNYHLTVDVQGYEPINEIVDLSFSSDHGVVLDLKKRNEFASRKEPGPAVSAHILSMPEKARNAFNDGKKKLTQGKNPKASIDEFQKAIAAAPSFYEAYEQMGAAYQQLGKPADAEQAVRKSIELSSDKYASADFDLAFLVMGKGQYAEGEKIARHGLELEPQSWMGECALGQALLAQDRLPDAQKSAERCRALNPNSARAYRLLAIIHLRQKDNDAAIADLDAYIKLDPDSPIGVRAKQMRDQLQASAPAKEKPKLAKPTSNP